MVSPIPLQPSILKHNIRLATSTFSATLPRRFAYQIVKRFVKIFKTIYRAESCEMGKEALITFVEKWKERYSKVTKPLIENPHILTFYSFSQSNWRKHLSH